MFPVVDSLCGAALGLFIWSESKYLDRKKNAAIKWRDEENVGLVRVLCGAYGLFGGSDQVVDARIFQPATPGLPSDVH